MAKCKLLMQTGQVQKIIDFFDGYSDDKVSCKYIKKVGIKAELQKTFPSQKSKSYLFFWGAAARFLCSASASRAAHRSGADRYR